MIFITVHIVKLNLEKQMDSCADKLLSLTCVYSESVRQQSKNTE